MMKDNSLTKTQKVQNQETIREVMRILILSFNKHKKVLRVVLAVGGFGPWVKYPFSKLKSLPHCKTMIASRTHGDSKRNTKPYV